MELKKGDIVGRKSYGKDILFYVDKIIKVKKRKIICYPKRRKIQSRSRRLFRRSRKNTKRTNRYRKERNRNKNNKKNYSISKKDIRRQKYNKFKCSNTTFRWR